MGIVVSTQVDPKALSEKLSSGPEPPEDAARDSPDNFSRVTGAYATLYARYESALAQGLDLVNLEDPQINRSSIPDITVSFDEELPTPIVFDVDLLPSLVEIYALRGWRGISLVESVLRERWTETGTTSTAGGTTLSVWAAVVPFFTATRNLLASLVRDALVDIEREARSRIQARLKTVDKAFEKAWTSELKMTVQEKTTYERGPEKERVPVVTRSFVFGNRALADDVFTDLTYAVKAKTALEEKVKRVQDEARQLAARQSSYERNKQNVGSPGYTSPYGEEATPENVQQKEEEKASLEAQLRDFMTALEAGILHNCPLALLVLDGLRPGFTQPDMEHSIGVAVDSLRMKVRKLMVALEKTDNQVGQRFPDDPAKTLGDFGKASSVGVENTLLDDVLLRADENAFLPLLSQDTLNDMVSADVIPKGGFSYFVYFHYMSGLLERQEAAAAKEGSVGNVLNMSLAVVSIATAFVPVLLPVEVVLGLFVLCHGIHEVVNQIAQFDKDVTVRLVQPGSSVIPALARIGELENMRKEMIQNVPGEILFGLVATVTGQRWLLTKRLLLGYAYYTDIKTLYLGLHGTPETQN